MNKEKSESVFVRILRFIKYNKFFTLLALIIISVIVYAVVADKGLLTRMKFQREKTKLEKQLIEEKKKQDTLRKEIDSLNNSDAKIERVAREKYGMTKEGEVIYKIEVDSNVSK
ncbi:MAG: septum formation initiator family protein [Ignavibacteriota bacterium]|nr:septum formation initiator family protein [Ignavibacteriota bacterium]